jgi:hypothetical protein
MHCAITNVPCSAPAASAAESPVDDIITTADPDDTDEDILLHPVSDDALEAAGWHREGRFTLMPGPTDCRCC